MRIVALLFAVLAVTVWWAPLDRLVQSAVLAFTAFACLALRRAIFPPRGSREIRPSGDTGKEAGDG